VVSLDARVNPDNTKRSHNVAGTFVLLLKRINIRTVCLLGSRVGLAGCWCE